MKKTLILALLIVIGVVALSFDVDRVLNATGMVMTEYTLLATDNRDQYSFEVEGMITGSTFCIATEEIEPGIYRSIYATNYHVVKDYSDFVTIDSTSLKKRLIYNTMEASETKERFDTEITFVGTPTMYSGVDFSKGLDEMASHTMELIAHNEIMDIAILSVELPFRVEPLVFAKERAVGDVVYCYSAAESIPFYLTTGMLGQTGLDLEVGWINLLRFSADVSYGSSGSALLNSDGKIVGVVRGMLVDSIFGTVIPGQYLAVDGEDFFAWLVVEDLLEGF